MSPEAKDLMRTPWREIAKDAWRAAREGSPHANASDTVVAVVVVVAGLLTAGFEFGRDYERDLIAATAKRPVRVETKTSSGLQLSCSDRDRAEYRQLCTDRARSGRLRWRQAGTP